MTEHHQSLAATETDTAPPSGKWGDVWRQFTSHRGAMAGGIFFVFIVLAVIIGPSLWTIEPTYIDIRGRLRWA